MLRKFILQLCVAGLAVGAVVAADDVLGRMDQAAPKFTGMEADLTRTTYTKVIDDKAVETGSIRLRKTGAKELQMLVNFVKPDPKTAAFRGRKAEIYYPKLKTVQEYDLGKQSDLVDQFLLVGFGATSKELRSAYNIKYVGEESIAGEKTHRLELTPTSDKVSDKIRKVELWIADSGAYPVQQRFTQPSGDYYLFTYSNVKLNPALTDEQLKLTLPKGVKREFPQK